MSGPVTGKPSHEPFSKIARNMALFSLREISPGNKVHHVQYLSYRMCSHSCGSPPRLEEYLRYGYSRSLYLGREGSAYMTYEQHSDVDSVCFPLAERRNRQSSIRSVKNCRQDVKAPLFTVQDGERYLLAENGGGDRAQFQKLSRVCSLPICTALSPPFVYVYACAQRNTSMLSPTSTPDV